MQVAEERPDRGGSARPPRGAQAAEGRSDLVFGRRDGKAFDGPTVDERAKKAWRAAGLEPITLHEARHTFASLMIAAGVNVKAVATHMGHASVTITYDCYRHLMPGNEDEAAARLDAYLARADTQARLAQLESRRRLGPEGSRR